MRVWRRDANPPHETKCVRTVKITGLRKNASVTTVCVLDTLGKMAVGTDDGTVVLVLGDLTRDRFTSVKTVHEDAYPITGVWPVSYTHLRAHET